VAALLKCSIRTPRTYTQALREVGRVTKKIKKGGRPRRITRRLECVFVREAMWGSCSTRGQLVRHLVGLHGVKCSKRAVKVILKRNKPTSCKKRRRAHLKEKHKRRPLEWAKAHERLAEEEWDTLLWSDECTGCLWAVAARV